MSFWPKIKKMKIVPWASKQKFLCFWNNFAKKMVRSTLLCRFSEGPFGQKFSFNAKSWFSKGCTLDVRFSWWIIEKRLQNQFLQCFVMQISVFKPNFRKSCPRKNLVQGAPHEPKFHQKPKVHKSSKMSPRVFQSMFLVVFWSKWCAALSSVVCLGAPSGKKSASTQSYDFQKSGLQM